MFVKYVMTNTSDYRGNVRLIVRNELSQEIAYSATEVLDPDMVELTQPEVDAILERAPGIWHTSRNALILKVDEYADDIRQSHLEVGSNTIDLEYKQVEEVLLSWQSAGADPNAVPPEISVWQQVTGETLTWVVNDIETQIAGYKSIVLAIRNIRLLGKQALRVALISDLETTYTSIIADLEVLRGTPNDPNV